MSDASRVRLYDYDASANCLKVRLLLRLLGRPWDRVPIDIFDGGTLDGAFAARNPVRQVPVLELASGETVFESNAILWYLAEGTPYLPGDRLARARVLQWLSFEQEYVMGGIGGPRFWRLTGREAADPGGFAARVAKGQRALAVLEGHLAGQPYLVGDRPTIADLSVFGYAHVAPEAGIALDGVPAVGAWIARLRDEPGFEDDLAPYPANARPGAGRSIYD